MEQLMYNHTTFHELKERAEMIEGDRIDHYVHDVASNLWIADDVDFCFTEDAHYNCMHPTDWALRQLSVKVGMPSGYAEKCIEKKHPELAALNFNTWLKEQKGKNGKEKDYLLREYQGKIDAVFSNAYTAFDSPYIMQAIEDVLDVREYDIKNHLLTSDRMYFSMGEREQMEVEGEELFPTINISSSDTGRAALRVTVNVWNEIDKTNLYIPRIGGTLYRQKHVGVDAIEFENELTLAIGAIPVVIDKAVKVIREAAKEKFDLKSKEVFNALMRQIMHSAIMKDEKEVEEVLRLADWRHGCTKWGIAKELLLRASEKDLEDRLVLEQKIGAFLVA